MPGSKDFFSLKNKVTIIPSSMAITGPPMTGASFPSIHDGTAITRQRAIPLPFFVKKFSLLINYFPC